MLGLKTNLSLESIIMHTRLRGLRIESNWRNKKPDDTISTYISVVDEKLNSAPGMPVTIRLGLRPPDNLTPPQVLHLLACPPTRPPWNGSFVQCLSSCWSWPTLYVSVSRNSVPMLVDGDALSDISTAEHDHPDDREILLREAQFIVVAQNFVPGVVTMDKDLSIVNAVQAGMSYCRMGPSLSTPEHHSSSLACSSSHNLTGPHVAVCEDASSRRRSGGPQPIRLR